MSLEQALAANTAALEKFCAMMATLYADQASITAMAYREAKAVEAEPSPPPAEPSPPPTAAKVGDAGEAAAPTYDATAAHVLAVARKHGPDAAKGILSKFGVKNLKELTADRWPAVIAECEALA